MNKDCIACGVQFDAKKPWMDFCWECFCTIADDGRCPVGPHQRAHLAEAGRFADHPVVRCEVKGEFVFFADAHPEPPVLWQTDGQVKP